ncbi:MAG TPA: alpha/beta fold hydrolase [Acetobacteraceae bacterium]|nr:alpha/beta fold hydrolase [Acetobacteraceae bacterium]
MSERKTQPLDPAGIRLHRTGRGPALVMMHCLGMTHHLWDCLGGMADKYTLVSYDLPGHGETPLPAAPYGIEELSAQLAGVLRREGIAKAHIMGISLGGLVAQCFAATEPGMTDRLVLCDTTPRYTDEARAMWVVRAAAARKDGAASLLPMIEKIWFTPGFVAADPPAVRLVRDTFRACSGEGYALACEALGAADLRDLAPRITAPTLVVCGADESQAFKDAAHWLRDTIAGARLELIPQAGHASVLEQPVRIETLLREFLG